MTEKDTFTIELNVLRNRVLNNSHSSDAFRKGPDINLWNNCIGYSEEFAIFEKSEGYMLVRPQLTTTTTNTTTTEPV